MFVSSSNIFNFLFVSIFILFISCSSFFYLIQYIFKPFILFLNSSIIIYFFQGVEGKDFSGIFKKLTVCFDLVPKSLYLFISDSTVELHSVDNSATEGKLNFFLKIRSLSLSFASLSFVGRIYIFSFLILNEKKSRNIFYNDLVVQGVVAYFYDNSKRIGIFLDAQDL